MCLMFMQIMFALENAMVGYSHGTQPYIGLYDQYLHSVRIKQSCILRLDYSQLWIHIEGAIGAIFTNQMLCLRSSEITLGTDVVEKLLSFWGLAHRPTHRGFAPSTQLVGEGTLLPDPIKACAPAPVMNSHLHADRPSGYATGYACVGLSICILCHRLNQNAIDFDCTVLYSTARYI